MGSITRDDVEKLHATGFFSDIDIHFARFVTGFSGSGDPHIFLGAALLSRHTGNGNVCLDLSAVADSQLAEPDGQTPSLTCPELDVWKDILLRAPVVGRPGELKPLILDGFSRLYLYRYFHYEQSLARMVLDRAGSPGDPVDTATFLRFYRQSSSESINWQCIAAFTAATKKLAVICGGPGTGKTTTVASILALLLEQAGGPLRIFLAAPTGKAALRLQEAIARSKQSLHCSEEIKRALPASASTLHRLLGIRQHVSYSRYNAEHPLPADVVVVDEASMIDLPLMTRFFRATMPQTKIILLGDRDQLASVESGTVLGDLCSKECIEYFSASFIAVCGKALGSITRLPKPSGSVHPLADCIVELKKNYRFSPGSSISRFSRSVQAGDGDAAVQVLRSSPREIQWAAVQSPHDLCIRLHELIPKAYGSYLEATSREEALKHFDSFRIICAVNEGPFGVRALNSTTEKILTEHSMIRISGDWYHGRPIMITRNNYSLNLFNGDVGILFRDPADRTTIRAYFPGTDGALNSFMPGRLPEHETAYALTVHKSQGSEFDTVLIILPETVSPLLTRELVYTATTRARKKVIIWASEGVLRSAVARATLRASGLREVLQQ